MIRDLRFTAASPWQVRTGLLGWVTFRLGSDWRVAGVAVRRTRAGELRFSFPARVDGAGREHPILLPTCDRVWHELEVAVLAVLDEPLQVLRPSPRGAHVNLASADEQAEESRSERHESKRTAGGQKP